MRAKTRHLACFGLSACTISLMGLLWLANLCLAADGSSSISSGNVDSRWQPWIGSWRLVSGDDSRDSAGMKEGYLLDIRSGEDGKSVIMKSSQAGEVLLEERIVVDGSRQFLKDTKCAGWYQYSWSDTGKRLLFESESGCPGEMTRFISGMSIITADLDWLDIQLLKSGEDRAISIRKYERIAASAGVEERAGARAFAAPRNQAATNFSIDEIIELSRKVAPEVIESALVELHQPFKINSKSLQRLADSRVPSSIVDVMVALSFPDKFTVERRRIVPVQRSASGASGVIAAPPPVWLPFGYWSIYGPYSGWYWSSFDPFYGYWGIGWDAWDGSGQHGRDRDDGGGRLINGRGYSRTDSSRPGSRPRYAQPRDDSDNGRGASRTADFSPPPAASTDSSPEASSNASGNSGSGSSSPPPAASPSASPSGYHSGGGERGHAKPRE